MRYASNFLRPLVFSAAVVFAAGAAQVGGSGQAEAADFFNGFETNTSGWSGSIVRVPSGTNGIPSKTGSFHAEADGRPAPGTSNVITQWGGYESVFPAGGYVTSLDIYLKFPPSPLSPLVNDTRFDWSSAINKPDGTHRQDFVFNVGFYNDTDATGAVDKNGEGIIFEDFHLVCYDVAPQPSPNVSVRVENQFGTHNLRIRQREILCVPSWKTVLGNPPDDDDHDDDDDDDDD